MEKGDVISNCQIMVWTTEKNMKCLPYLVQVIYWPNARTRLLLLKYYCWTTGEKLLSIFFHQRESTLLYVSRSPKDKAKYFLTFQVSLQFRNKLWMGTRRTLDFLFFFFFFFPSTFQDPRSFLGDKLREKAFVDLF